MGTHGTPEMVAGFGDHHAQAPFCQLPRRQQTRDATPNNQRGTSLTQRLMHLMFRLRGRSAHRRPRAMIHGPGAGLGAVVG